MRGKQLLSLCKSHGLLIANGRTGYDKLNGNFTTKDNSVIDYVVMSAGLLAKVDTLELVIFDPLISDVHKAVEFSFKLFTANNVVVNNVRSVTNKDVNTNSVLQNNPNKVKSSDAPKLCVRRGKTRTN